MLFSSMTFIYIFLPLVCSVYLLARNDIRNHILLAASIIFYGWGEPTYLAIMILTILINYVGAIGIDKYQTKKGLIAALTIISNLSFLFYFKYFNFAIDNFNSLFSENFDFIKVIMPIGISFYTFQSMSYLIDVYRGEVKVQKDIYKLSLYIALFPQLIAGPIVKYHDIETQIETRKITFDNVSLGVKLFIIGLSKKVLIANTLGSVSDKIFALPIEQFNTFTAWIGAICYSFQLFYDFSGYSNMAIGLGLIFGFRFLENFNYPYISKSITEFWRRWHISLSTWFKEYLYIPLGGNRKGKIRTYINLFIVFLATGFWHGASWSFIIWGLWHGLFIVFEKASGWNKEKSDYKIRFFQHIYTLLIVIIGWVIFRSDNFSYAYDYIKNMFGLINNHKIAYDLSYYFDNVEILAFIGGILCAVPFFNSMLDITKQNKIKRTAVNFWLFLLFILSSLSIAASTYNPFIYFRF